MRIAPVAFILVLAVALRVPTLGVWSVWIDEAFTLHDALHDPPLYGLFYRVMRPVIEVFGSSELALRALPCLLGLATIGVLGTVRMAGVSVGEQRLAALFLALSSFHVFWFAWTTFFPDRPLLGPGSSG